MKVKFCVGILVFALLSLPAMVFSAEIIVSGTVNLSTTALTNGDTLKVDNGDTNTSSTAVFDQGYTNLTAIVDQGDGLLFNPGITTQFTSLTNSGRISINGASPSNAGVSVNNGSIEVYNGGGFDNSGTITGTGVIRNTDSGFFFNSSSGDITLEKYAMDGASSGMVNQGTITTEIFQAKDGDIFSTGGVYNVSEYFDVNSAAGVSVSVNANGGATDLQATVIRDLGPGPLQALIVDGKVRLEADLTVVNLTLENGSELNTNGFTLTVTGTTTNNGGTTVNNVFDSGNPMNLQPADNGAFMALNPDTKAAFNFSGSATASAESVIMSPSQQSVLADQDITQLNDALEIITTGVDTISFSVDVSEYYDTYGDLLRWYQYNTGTDAVTAYAFTVNDNLFTNSFDVTGNSIFFLGVQPEPTTLFLLGSALLGLFPFRRKK